MKKNITLGLLILIGILSILFIFRNSFFEEAKNEIEKTKQSEEEKSKDLNSFYDSHKKSVLDSNNTLKKENSNNKKEFNGLQFESDPIENITSSEISFNVDGLIDTKGYFKKFKIYFKMPKNNFEDAKFEVTIYVESIYTNEMTRDKHLLSEEFFNTNKYPEIVFKSSKIEKIEKQKYQAYGILEMMGLKKEFSFPFNFSGTGTNKSGKEIGKFDGVFEIDRTEFGMSETSSVGNIVNVEFYTEMAVTNK